MRQPPSPAPVSGRVSIIIPTRNEAARIGSLVDFLQRTGANDIIVVDGRSTDNTAAAAEQAGATVLHCPQQRRAAQLNHGAAHAAGDILYFLHADTTPPPDFLTRIRAAVAAGAVAGCFRLRFDHPHWFLRANAWMTRLNINAVRFGDQSLFVRRDVFAQAGGYRADFQLLEDQEIVARLRRLGSFLVLPAYVVTSARKYLVNGVFRLQGIFTLLVFLYKLGASQERLARVYKRLVR